MKTLPWRNVFGSQSCFHRPMETSRIFHPVQTQEFSTGLTSFESVKSHFGAGLISWPRMYFKLNGLSPSYDGVSVR